MLLTSIVIFIKEFIKRVNLIDEKYSIPDKEIITLISNEGISSSLNINVIYAKVFKAITNFRTIPYFKDSNTLNNFYSITNLFLMSFARKKNLKNMIVISQILF